MIAEETPTRTERDGLDAAMRIAASEDLAALASELLASARALGAPACEAVISRADVVLARAFEGDETSGVAIPLARDAGAPPVRVVLRLEPEREAAPDPSIERVVAIAASVAARLVDARQWERLALERRELLSIVSHDLRTPLQSLGLGLDAVQMQIDATPVGAQVASTFARMRRAVASAGQLLGDVVDITRVQSGALSLRMQPCDVGQLLRDLAEEHRPPLAARGLELVAPEPEVREVIGDAQRLAQALAVLLSNAAKHATAGPVALRARRAEGGVRFEVADAGPGISSELRDRLFEPPTRSPSLPSRRGGIGLGLTLAKGIVAAHGGRIGVVSTPGSGSTFFVELPPRPAIG